MLFAIYVTELVCVLFVLLYVVVLRPCMSRQDWLEQVSSPSSFNASMSISPSLSSSFHTSNSPGNRNEQDNTNININEKMEI
jgi:hypothetical protein